MSKLAFVFPGQGSQFVGMGKDICDKYPEAKNVFNEADSILGFSLSDLCFNGPEDELKLTVNTQPALYVTSIATLRVLESYGIKPDAAAGHSIGEYAALTFAGAISFADGLKLVRKRGEIMNDAAKNNPGTMAAILGLDETSVKNVCANATGKGVVEIANYNSSAQIVISGSVDAVKEASELAKAAGAKKVIPLSVSGGFHSSLMESASGLLANELALIQMNDLRIPVIANVTADYISSQEEIKLLLAKQISGSVLWDHIMRKMASDGFTKFVEVGSGKVLTGLIKRAIDGSDLYNTGDIKSIDDTIEALKSL